MQKARIWLFVLLSLIISGIFVHPISAQTEPGLVLDHSRSQSDLDFDAVYQAAQGWINRGFTVFVISAQTEPGLVLDHSRSQSDLDFDAVYQAAQGWINRGFTVFVLLTDYAPANRDDWYAYLDAWEQEQGARDSDNFMNPDAIAFEASTVSSNSYSTSITVQDALINTPLWDDPTRNLINGQFRIAMGSGNYTAAFVDVIETAYLTAYPPPPPTPLPTNTPLPTATTVPLVLTQQAADLATQRAYELAVIATQGAIQATQAANEQIAAEAARVAQATQTAQQAEQAAAEEAVRQARLAEFMGSVLQVAVLVIGAVVVIGVVYFVILPIARGMQRRVRYHRHAEQVELRINNLLMAISVLLRDGKLEKAVNEIEEYENTALYTMWLAYGGEKYAEKHAQFVEWLKAIIGTHAQAQDNLYLLAEKKGMRLETRVHELEVIHLTLVGTTEQILNMTQVEQEQLLNPLSGLSPEVVGGELYEQMRQQFERLQEGDTLKLALFEADPANVDAEGVLGYVQQIKLALNELQSAKNVAEPTLEAANAEAQTLRTQLEAGPKEVLTMSEVLTYVHAQLQLAQTAQTDERWLDVARQADSILKYVRQMPAILAAYIAAYEAAEGRLAQVQELRTAGFNLSALDKLVTEVTNDYVDFKAALAVGDLAKAGEATREAEADSAILLVKAEEVKAAYEANLLRLQKLSAEVAQLRGVAEKTAQPALDTLRTYPKSNWGTAEQDFANAMTFITQQFTDPASAENLEGKILLRNQLTTAEGKPGRQDFAGASQDLVSAFAKIETVKQLLQAVTDQLKLVQTTERNVARALDDARRDLAKAKERRDSAPTKVDAAVDQLIAQTEQQLVAAEAAITAREFTTASQKLTEVRRLANQALTDADQQIMAIDNMLEGLEDAKRGALVALDNALSAQSELPDAAKKKEVADLIANARDSLQHAKLAEQRIAGLEDAQLVEVLHDVIYQYDASKDFANGARQQAKAEAERYKEAYETSREALRLADAAIREARKAVSNADANRAGESALRRADSVLPQMSGYGTGYEALRQIQENARQAQTAAAEAKQEAQERINHAERERREAEEERERRRQAQAELDRQAAQARQRQLDDERNAEQQRQRDRREEQDRRDRREAESRRQTQAASKRESTHTVSKR